MALKNAQGNRENQGPQEYQAAPTNFFCVYVNESLLGSFLSVSGINYELEMETYYEGGRNTGPLFFPSNPAAQKLVLERGVMKGDCFNKWMRDSRQGIFERMNGSVVLSSMDGTPLYTWEFVNAYPVSIEGPSLNAMHGDVAVNRIELMHGGMLLSEPQT